MSWWKTKQRTGIIVGASTDVGMVRTENQDAFGRFTGNGSSGPEEQLFILADGMGGHLDGREASRIAVEEVRRAFFAAPDKSIEQRLLDALKAANEMIIQRSKDRTGAEKMGTTCTVLLVCDDQAYVAHVGDSRAYHLSRSGVLQLTRDHTMVEEMRRQGLLTDDEARSHPRRHALTRALGIEPVVHVDLLDPMPVQSGEWFLLCSDGLAAVEPEEMLAIVTSRAPQEACDELVRMANDRGGHDNVTVLLVQIQ